MLKIKYLYLLLLLLLSSCANRISPSGGPKDEMPPKILFSTPKNQSLNFTGTSITLSFDEWVKLDNIKNELIITPNIKGSYKSKTQKNIVALSFEKPFDENTTYTLNFRNAIKDITESNASPDNLLVFSTGNFLDSLSLSGSVRNILTHKALTDITVSLYNAQDTLTVLKNNPYYMTKSDAQGNFVFKNIKHGQYLIYAIEDNNGNSTYDEGKERIAFLKDTLSLDHNIDSLNLLLAKEDYFLPEIKQSRASYTHNTYIISLSKGISHFTVDFLEKDSIAAILNKEGNEITFFNSLSHDKKIPIQLSLTDSSGNHNIVMDTLLFNTDNKAKKTPLEHFFLPKSNSFIPPDPHQFKIVFNKPIEYFNVDKSNYYINNDTLNSQPLNTLTNKFKWNLYRNEILIELPKTIEGTITLNFKSPTFISYDKDTLSTQEVSYQTLTSKNTGSIMGSVKTEKRNFVLQLLDNNYQVVAESKGVDFTFRLLQPGTYYLRAFIDNNHNNSWDSSQLIKNILAEPVYMYPKAIQVRENWEIRNEIFNF